MSKSSHLRWLLSPIRKVLSESICYYHAKVLQERRRNQGSWGGKKARGGGCTILFRWNIFLSAQYQSLKDNYYCVSSIGGGSTERVQPKVKPDNIQSLMWNQFLCVVGDNESLLTQFAIQELKGNIRVFCRYFPFFDSSWRYAPPHLEIWPDTSSLRIFPGFDHCSGLKRKEGRRSST